MKGKNSYGRRKWQKWVPFLAVLLIAITLFLPQGEPGIVGRVVLNGKPPPEFAIKLDAASAKLRPNGLMTRHYVVSSDGGLANVFVSIKGVDRREAFERPKDPVVVEFRGAQIEPYVLGVRTGRSLRVQNSDSNMHNVHCVTKPGSGNREMNFALPPGNRPKQEPWYGALYRSLFMKPPLPRAEIQQVFDKAEAFIRMKCDVHPWEYAYICVSEHPFFAVTDKDGRFRIPGGLPSGRYVIEARHLKAGVVTQEILLGRNERKHLTLALQPRELQVGR